MVVAYFSELKGPISSLFLSLAHLTPVYARKKSAKIAQFFSLPFLLGKHLRGPVLLPHTVGQMCDISSARDIVKRRKRGRKRLGMKEGV